MSELTTKEYSEIKKRMTQMEDGICGLKCKACPLSLHNNPKQMGCCYFELKYPSEAIAIIKKWAEEHPIE